MSKRQSDHDISLSPKRSKREIIYFYSRFSHHDPVIPKEFSSIARIQGVTKFDPQCKQLGTQQSKILVDECTDDYFHKVLPYLIAKCEGTSEKIEFVRSYLHLRNYVPSNEVDSISFPKEIILYLYLYGVLENEKNYYKTIIKTLRNPNIKFADLKSHFSDLDIKINQLLNHFGSAKKIKNALKFMPQDKELFFLKSFRLISESDFILLRSSIELRKQKDKSIVANTNLRNTLMEYCKSNRRQDYLAIYHLMEIYPDEDLVKKDHYDASELKKYLLSSLSFDRTHLPETKFYIQLLEKNIFNDETLNEIFENFAKVGDNFTCDLLGSIFKSQYFLSKTINFYKLLEIYLDKIYDYTCAHLCFIKIHQFDIQPAFWAHCDNYATPNLPSQQRSAARRERPKASDRIMDHVWNKFPYEYPKKDAIIQFCTVELNNNIKHPSPILDYLEKKVLELFKDPLDPEFTELCMRCNVNEKSVANYAKAGMEFAIRLIHKYCEDLLATNNLKKLFSFCGHILKCELAENKKIDELLKKAIDKLSAKPESAMQLSQLSIIDQFYRKNATAVKKWILALCKADKLRFPEKEFWEAAPVSYYSSKCNRMSDYNAYGELIGLGGRDIQTMLLIFSDFYDEHYLRVEIDHLSNKLGAEYAWMRNAFVEYYKFFNNIHNYLEFGKKLGPSGWGALENWMNLLDSNEIMTTICSRTYYKMVKLVQRIDAKKIRMKVNFPPTQVEPQQIAYLQELRKEIQLPEAVGELNSHGIRSYSDYLAFSQDLNTYFINPRRLNLAGMVFHPNQLYEVYYESRNRELFVQKLKDLLQPLGELSPFHLAPIQSPNKVGDVLDAISSINDNCEIRANPAGVNTFKAQCNSFSALLRFWLRWDQAHYLICTVDTTPTQLALFLHAFLSSRYDNHYVLAYPEMLCDLSSTFFKQFIALAGGNQSPAKLILIYATQSTHQNLPDFAEMATQQDEAAFLADPRRCYTLAKPTPETTDVFISETTSEFDLIKQLDGFEKEKLVLVISLPKTSNYDYEIFLFKLLILRKLQTPLNMKLLTKYQMEVEFKKEAPTAKLWGTGNLKPPTSNLKLQDLGKIMEVTLHTSIP